MAEFIVRSEGIYWDMDYRSESQPHRLELVMDKETFIKAFEEYVLPNLAEMRESNWRIADFMLQTS